MNAKQNETKEHVGIFLGAVYVVVMLCISLVATQILFGASALGWTLLIVLLTIVGFEISKGRLRTWISQEGHIPVESHLAEC